MLGFAILGLLGIALVVNLADDDDDAQEAAANNSPQLEQGTGGDDLIEVDGGNDTVFAGGGDDLVRAGDGSDRVFGGDGDDLLVGEDGNDFLRGGAGEDVLYGSDGEDTMNGDLGDDLLDGTDILDVAGLLDAAEAAAADGRSLSDNEVASFIDFESDSGQSDELNGGVGNDILIAGGNDVVITGLGSDTVELGDWIEADTVVTIQDFDTDEDVIIYNYSGDTPPELTFDKSDDGAPALLADGKPVAIFENADVSELQANAQIGFVSLA